MGALMGPELKSCRVHLTRKPSCNAGYADEVHVHCPHGALNGTELASSWKRQCETVGERGGLGFGLYSGGINGEGEGVGGGN